MVGFFFAAQANLDAETSDIKDNSKREKTGNYITIYALLSYHSSRENVHIRSKSTTNKSTINLKFLNHSLDLEVFAYHVQFLETFSTTGSLNSFLKPQGLRIPDFTPTRPDLKATKNYLTQTVTAVGYHKGTCTTRPCD